MVLHCVYLISTHIFHTELYSLYLSILVDLLLVHINFCVLFHSIHIPQFFFLLVNSLVLKFSITNKTSVKIVDHTSLQTTWESLGYTSRCKPAQSLGMSTFTFTKYCQLLFRSKLYRFMLPPAVYKSPHFLPTSSLKLGIIRYFNLWSDFSLAP